MKHRVGVVKRKLPSCLEFGLTKCSRSGEVGRLGMNVCPCVHAALCPMGKLRPNYPLHCPILPDGFLKWMFDSKSILAVKALFSLTMEIFFNLWAFILSTFALETLK